MTFRNTAATVGVLALSLCQCTSDPGREVVADSAVDLGVADGGDAGTLPPPIPNRTLGAAFFGLDLQYPYDTPGEVPWPNDAGFEAHQIVRAWLGGAGLWADVHRDGRGKPFRWDAVDSFLRLASRHQQKVLYVVSTTPAFAVAKENRSELCAWPDLYPGGCNPPDDWNDDRMVACLPPAERYRSPNCTFKEFLTALVRRYRGTGVQSGCGASEPQCNGVISYYELGNEVDSFTWPQTRFWAGTASGSSTDSAANALKVLAHMVEAAAEVIRREDPSALIVGPSFTGYDGAILFEKFYRQPEIDPLESIDILSFHGYREPEEEHPPEAIREMVERYQAAIRSIASDRPAVSEKDLWNTEWSWGRNYGPPCTGPDQPCIHWPSKETAYLTRGFLHQWDLGVASATWFSWGTNGWGEIWCPRGNASEDHNIGCDQLADDTPQINVTGRAYVELADWLSESTRTGPCLNEGIIWSCPIERPGLNHGRGLIIWHDDWEEFETTATLAGDFTSAWHLSGARGPLPAGEVPVFSLPILVH